MDGEDAKVRHEKPQRLYLTLSVILMAPWEVAGPPLPWELGASTKGGGWHCFIWKGVFLIVRKEEVR